MRPASRETCLGAALAFMAAGLVWRLVPMGLPVLALRYGGAILLWDAMVFALVAAIRPTWWRIRACLAVATLIVVAAELIRLYHAPASTRSGARSPARSCSGASSRPGTSSPTKSASSGLPARCAERLAPAPTI